MESAVHITTHTKTPGLCPPIPLEVNQVAGCTPVNYACNCRCGHCRTVVYAVVQVHPANAAAVDEPTCRQGLGADDELAGHVPRNHVLGLQARYVRHRKR